jgi:hypothetical protein
MPAGTSADGVALRSTVFLEGAHTTFIIAHVLVPPQRLWEPPKKACTLARARSKLLI